VWTLLAVLAILLVTRRPGPLMLEWIRDPINATAVQAISAAVQAIGALVLIGVTWVSVKEAQRISRATKVQAEATARAVEIAQRQRRDAVRPALHLDLRGSRNASKASTWVSVSMLQTPGLVQPSMSNSASSICCSNKSEPGARLSAPHQPCSG
jgi:hypothetical protein